MSHAHPAGRGWRLLKAGNSSKHESFQSVGPLSASHFSKGKALGGSGPRSAVTSCVSCVVVTFDLVVYSQQGQTFSVVKKQNKNLHEQVLGVDLIL